MLKVFLAPDSGLIQWHKQLEFWGYGEVYTISDLDLALCMENGIDNDATRAECAEFMEKIADAFRQATCSSEYSQTFAGGRLSAMTSFSVPVVCAAAPFKVLGSYGIWVFIPLLVMLVTFIILNKLGSSPIIRRSTWPLSFALQYDPLAWCPRSKAHCAHFRSAQLWHS